MESSKTRQSGRSKTNLVLAATLIAVSGFAYWLEVRKKPELRRQQEEQGRLISFDGNAEVESVRIVSKEKGIDYSFRCIEGCKLSNPAAKWEITEPIAFKADEANVGTFISGITAANVLESIPLEGDSEAKLDQFGLGKDKRETRRAEIKLKNNAAPYVVYIGDNSAVGENMYVYLAGPGAKAESVRIIPGYVKANLERNLSYWRAKRLFDFAVGDVQKVALSNPSGTIELVHEEGHWHLMPGKQLADDEAVETFVTGLVFMNAQDFVSDAKDNDRVKFGLTPTKAHSTLTLKVAKRPDVVIEVYDVLRGKQPKLYAMVSGRNYIVELERTNAEKFAKKPDAFRFRNLLTAAEKETTGAVHARFKKDEYRFKLENGQWQLVAGKLEGFSSSIVDQALTKVGAARIAEFAGKKQVPGGNDELSSWELIDKSGKKIREFAIYGSPAKGDYYVKLSSGELGKLERGSGSAVPSKASDLQSAQAAESGKPPQKHE